jgi:hypothetical protein
MIVFIAIVGINAGRISRLTGSVSLYIFIVGLITKMTRP